MRPILLVIFLWSTLAFSQVELPPLGDYQYQAYCDSCDIDAAYYNDTSFLVMIYDYSGQFYYLKGRMSFNGDIVNLTYLDDVKVNCPYFEKGKEEKLLIRNRGEELIPVGEPYIFCNYLSKALVRYCR